MRNLDMIFEELGHIEYMVKESNSSVNPDLVYDAFWSVVNEGIGDWIKRGAKAVGSAAGNVVKSVSNAIDYTKELGEKAWGKIKELGEDFITWVKEVKTKITEALTWIKQQPAKVWSKMQEFWTWLGQKVANAIDKIKKGLETFYMIMNTFIFKPIANAFKEAITNTELAYQYAAGATSQNLLDMKNNINKFKGKCGDKYDSLVNTIDKIVDKLPTDEQVVNFLKKLGKGIGTIIIGLIVSPFVLAFFLGKGVVALGQELYKLGDLFVTAIWNVVGDFTKFVGEVKSEVKAGYQEATTKSPVQAVSGVPTGQNENRRNVMTFDNFLKRG